MSLSAAAAKLTLTTGLARQGLGGFVGRDALSPLDLVAVLAFIAFLKCAVRHRPSRMFRQAGAA